jgi:hypothetical protein
MPIDPEQVTSIGGVLEIIMLYSQMLSLSSLWMLDFLHSLRLNVFFVPTPRI